MLEDIIHMMIYQQSVHDFHSSVKRSPIFVLDEKPFFHDKKSVSLLCMRSNMKLFSLYMTNHNRLQVALINFIFKSTDSME